MLSLLSVKVVSVSLVHSFRGLMMQLHVIETRWQSSVPVDCESLVMQAFDSPSSFFSAFSVFKIIVGSRVLLHVVSEKCWANWESAHNAPKYTAADAAHEIEPEYEDEKCCRVDASHPYWCELNLKTRTAWSCSDNDEFFVKLTIKSPWLWFRIAEWVVEFVSINLLVCIWIVLMMYAYIVNTRCLYDFDIVTSPHTIIWSKSKDTVLVVCEVSVGCVEICVVVAPAE